MLRDLILHYLNDQPDIQRDKLADPTAKMNELGLDSLGMVEMLFEIEDRYGFQIDNPVRYGTMTLDEVVADLESAVRAHCGGTIPELPPEPAVGTPAVPPAPASHA